MLPGGIIAAIMQIVSPGRRFTSGEAILRWMSYSILNDALWCWLYWIIIKKFEVTNIILFWILLTVAFIGSSTITGILLGIFRKKSIIRKLLNKMGLHVEHPCPTAWEYKFSGQNLPCFVIVTLINGKIIYGYFGARSLASTDLSFSDIYLEYLYNVDEGGEWTLIPNRSVWISPSQIESIEFIENKDRKDEESEQ